MIHLNPFYIFSHVIFINIDKKFIQIEPEVYKNIHALIFNGKKSSPKQRRLLRKLFYNVYYDYFYKHIEIDHQTFNSSLRSIYKGEIAIDFDHTTIVEESEGDTVYQDLVLYDSEESTGEDKIWEENSSERDCITRALSIEDIFFSNINAEMNYVANRNTDFALLVKFFGWGKIQNMYRNIVCFKNFRIKDMNEYNFIYYSLSFLAKYRLNYFKQRFDFICENCLNIGSHHINIYKETKNPNEVSSCFKTWWFFDRGIIQGQKHSDILNHQRQGQIYYDQNIDYNINKKDIVLLSTRTSIQIGGYFADQSSTDHYDKIIQANDRLFKYEYYKHIITEEENNSEASQRGLLSAMLHITTELEELNTVMKSLENPFDNHFPEFLEKFLELKRRIIKKQEENNSIEESSFAQRFRFGVQSIQNSSSILDKFK